MFPAGSPPMSERMNSWNLKCDDDRAMVGSLRAIPADARETLHLLAGRKGRSVRLAVTDDLGHRIGIGACQRPRQPDIVELAEMALDQAARMKERPAVVLRPA